MQNDSSSCKFCFIRSFASYYTKGHFQYVK